MYKQRNLVFVIICLFYIMFPFRTPAQELSFQKENPELFKKYKQLELNASKRVKIEILKLRGFYPIEKAYAAIELRNMGQEANGAILALIETFRDNTEMAWKFSNYPVSNRTTTPSIEAKETLQKIGKPAVEALLASLNEPDESIIYFSSEALSKCREPRIVKPLADVLVKDNSDRVYRSVINTLAELNSSTSVNGLFSAYSKTSGYTKDLALSAIEKAKDRHTVNFLLDALKDTADYVRWSAARVLGSLKDTSAVEPLIILLKDKDYEVRRFTAEALGLINDKRAVEPLLPLLKDNYSQVVKSAAYALGSLRDPRALKPLVELSKNSDANVVLWAAEALGYLNDPLAVETLIALLKHENRNIRDDVAIALSNINDASTIEPVVEFFKARSGIGKIMDFMQGNRTKEQYQIEILTDLLKYCYAKEEGAIVSTLIKLKNFNSAEYIVKLAMDTTQNADIRDRAIRTLVKMDFPEVVERLITLLKDKDILCKISAARILRELNDSRAIEPMIAFLKENNEYPSAVSAASDALSSLTGKDFGKDYSKWKSWFDKQKPRKK